MDEGYFRGMLNGMFLAGGIMLFMPFFRDFVGFLQGMLRRPPATVVDRKT